MIQCRTQYRTMISFNRKFNVFLVSLGLGLASSALLFLVPIGLGGMLPNWVSSPSSDAIYKGVLVLSCLKSLVVNSIASFVAPVSRWKSIVRSTTVLTFLEALIYIGLSDFRLPG
jgi:hypothetical protein